ncbi:hypothetical protein quinque_007690 [Culex quinquefasciatus]
MYQLASSSQLKTSMDLKETTIWESKAKSIDEVSPFSSPSPGDSAAFRRKRRRCFPDNPIDFCNIEEYNQWRLEDIARAGMLLGKPPRDVSFDDEFEMRKVYSMIYDVFRSRYGKVKDAKTMAKQLKVAFAG